VTLAVHKHLAPILKYRNVERCRQFAGLIRDLVGVVRELECQFAFVATSRDRYEAMAAAASIAAESGVDVEHANTWLASAYAVFRGWHSGGVGAVATAASVPSHAWIIP
jgi:hypothetical protein